MASVSWDLPWHCATLALIQDHEDRIFPWRDEEEPPSGKPPCVALGQITREWNEYALRRISVPLLHTGLALEGLTLLD